MGGGVAKQATFLHGSRPCFLTSLNVELWLRHVRQINHFLPELLSVMAFIPAIQSKLDTWDCTEGLARAG